MHHTQSNDPEIIAFYNNTKGGVDALDEKCTVYSTSRRTRRWPLAIFFTLMNISLVNAYVIYRGFPGNPELTRLEYIKNLAEELLDPHLNRRLQNDHLPRELRLNISRILKIPAPCKARRDLCKQIYVFRDML
ncbi:uncharacterized protein LOC126252156 [Schistocerca nitens]|uniref:uncharacterized protein LOC126252156 n=1 Tax=Schistocerca nitens TaxID=7011 RepID=UPI002118A0C1|nr:uncharacterized protein LOC126252156 [Schistocerca nitens]